MISEEEYLQSMCDLENLLACIDRDIESLEREKAAIVDRMIALENAGYLKE